MNTATSKIASSLQDMPCNNSTPDYVAYNMMAPSISHTGTNLKTQLEFGLN